MAPFVVLTLVAALLVSALAAQQIASSGAQQLDTLGVREQDNVNTVFNSIEERQLADLRLLAATEGVADAVRARDVATLGRLVLPVVANALPVQVTADIVATNGQSLLQVQADPSHPSTCICTSTSDKASYDHLDDVLNGRADAYGTRFEGLTATGSSGLLYTIGPIIDVNGYLAGAVVIGEPVTQIVGLIQQRVHLQLSLFTPSGSTVASTRVLDFPIPPLTPSERSQVLGQEVTISKRVSASGHEAAIFYVPWILRFQPAGYAAIVVPADPVVNAQNYVLLVLVVVSFGALALTLVVAGIVARSITRPMQQLVTATSEVAAGNLDYQAEIEAGDEIGRLAGSFNRMTTVLKERTLRLESLTDEVLLALAATIDARDSYTHGHSMRVAIYAEALARARGYCDTDREAVKRGCMVHDIGKIGVPDTVLRKTGPLDEKEWLAMREHPIVGHRLVSALPWNPIVPDVVLHHHEKWDGTGYPAGLATDAIPLAARIVAIADALDAMTSPRPYRPARTFRQAAQEVVAEAGGQFDPRLVAVFMANRLEIAALVEGALQVWVPKVHRKRRQTLRLVPDTGRAEVG